MLIRYGRQSVRVSTAGKVRDFSPQRAAPLSKSTHDMPVLAQREVEV